MVRLGLTRVLAVGCAEVFDADDGSLLLADAERLRPDVVVLAQDGAQARQLCAGLRAVSPDMKVILWPRDEDRMEIFDPGDAAPRRLAAALPEALLDELGCGHPTTERK